MAYFRYFMNNTFCLSNESAASSVKTMFDCSIPRLTNFLNQFYCYETYSSKCVIKLVRDRPIFDTRTGGHHSLVARDEKLFNLHRIGVLYDGMASIFRNVPRTVRSTIQPFEVSYNLLSADASRDVGMHRFPVWKARKSPPQKLADTCVREWRTLSLTNRLERTVSELKLQKTLLFQRCI